MTYAIPLWTPPALPIAGSSELFPVRRVFCVGRNYVEHQKEMGGDGREQPFFFIKSARGSTGSSPNRFTRSSTRYSSCRSFPVIDRSRYKKATSIRARSLG